MRDCPCHSGKPYRDCCEPLHKGTPSCAETPEALMRSRYAAFALGLGDYLIETLTQDHEDRGIDPKSIARAQEKQRFLGLRIHDAWQDEVLFEARIFEKGVDRSFAELSTFEREGGTWRYARGVIIPKEHAVIVSGARRFDRRAFFDAHEVWEEQWRDEKDPAMRTFLQGLIQVAAGFHKHAEAKDRESTERLLARGLEKLDEAPGLYAGLDVATFRAAIRAWRDGSPEKAPPHMTP